MWIYSGRRGVHCWVVDKNAKKLTSQARTAIVEYLSIIKGDESVAKKVNINYNLHPSLHRASKIIQIGFKEYACNKQKFLGDETRVAKLLALVPSEYKFTNLILEFNYVI